MTIWDDRILEYIREEGHGSPKELKDSGYFEISNTQIGRRLKILAEHGMLRQLGANAVYQLTERGEAYLDEELDAREHMPDEPVDVEDGNGGPSAGETTNGA
jgi:repressor of nif and glnA expression